MLSASERSKDSGSYTCHLPFFQAWRNSTELVFPYALRLQFDLDALLFQLGFDRPPDVLVAFPVR